MAWTAWTRAAVLAAIAVAGLPAPAHAVEPPTTAAAAAAAAAAASPAGESAAPLATPDPQQYVASLAATLTSPMAQQPQRDEAALRLADVRAPDILTRALAGPDERAQLAAARAVAEAAVAEPMWVGPLVRMLARDYPAGDPLARPLVEAAARALARFDTTPAAYDGLIRLAQGPQAPPVRVAAARALGAVVQKPAAESLVTLVNDPNEAAAVRSAAADALAHMSGVDMGSPAAWTRWLDVRAQQGPDAWRREVIAEQHAHLEAADDQVHNQVRQLRAAVEQILVEQYQRQPAADRPRVLLGYLDNPDADVRGIGAAIVVQAVGQGQPLTPEIRRRVIDLVNDASPAVRLQATITLYTLADPSSLGALLLRMQLERDVDVLAQLCTTVARLNDVRALPELERLLGSPAPRVVVAAASAIRALGPSIQKNPDLAGRVLNDLQQVIRQRTGPPGQANGNAAAQEIRSALVGATAAAARAAPTTDMLDYYNGFLVPAETPQTRAAALQSLGTLGPAAVNVIVRELDRDAEPDAAVRAAAATALGATGSFDYAEQLYRQIARDPSPAVREAGWRAIQEMAASPTATARQLSPFADLLNTNREYEHEVVILKELCQRLARMPNELRNLAIERQRVGDLDLQQLNQPQDAIRYLSDALAYWQANNGPPVTTVQLVKSLMNAYLRSKQYREAARFAEQQIRASAPNQLEVGPPIWHTAEQLIQKGDPASYRDAAQLIREALNMDPPLDEEVRGKLQELQQRLPPTSRS